MVWLLTLLYFAIIKPAESGSNKDLSGKPVNLALDIYIPRMRRQPKNSLLFFSCMAAVLLPGIKAAAVAVMEKFVKAGYVAASIDYRLATSGIYSGQQSGCP